MKLYKKIFLVLLMLVIIPWTLLAQKPSRTVRNAQKKTEKKEIRLEKDYEKARKKTLKHRYDMQSKEVQDRMKESKREADRYNKRKKEPFLKRLFRKKRK